MNTKELEQNIFQDLNHPVLKEKFLKLAKERGFRYQHVDFSQVEILDHKIQITINAQ